MNRDFEMGTYIDYPQSTGQNVSARRAEVIGSLPGRIDAGITEDAFYERQLSLADIGLRNTLLFAAGSIAVMLVLVIIAIQ